MKIRIWCEFVPAGELMNPLIVDVLKKFEVTLNYKIETGNFNDEFFNMLKLYNEQSIPVLLWPTLPDKQGYWVNERNAEVFHEHVKKIIDEIEYRGLNIHGFCIDMEPPISEVMKITNYKSCFKRMMVYIKALLLNLSKKRFKEASATFANTAGYLKTKGLESYGTGARYCYYDLRFGSDFIQNFLETPFFNIPWDKYNLMYYATIIRSEHKKGDIDVNYHMFRQISYLKEKLGNKLAVSMGLSNVGKLGNEPYYSDIRELSLDVGILKECGVEDISIYSLDGLMEPDKLYGFLNIVKEASPYKPPYCTQSEKRERYLKTLYKSVDLYYKIFG